MGKTINLLWGGIKRLDNRLTGGEGQ